MTSAQGTPSVHPAGMNTRFCSELGKDKAVEKRSGVSHPLPICTVFCRFFSLVGTYLLFGWIYTRFVGKRHGWKQIPNAEFWQEIGHLQAVSARRDCRRLVLQVMSTASNGLPVISPAGDELCR